MPAAKKGGGKAKPNKAALKAVRPRCSVSLSALLLLQAWSLSGGFVFVAEIIATVADVNQEKKAKTAAKVRSARVTLLPREAPAALTAGS